MTEPRHVSELLTEWVARVAALGPFLVRIEMDQPTLDKLKTLTPEVKSQVARGQALGYLSSDRVSPLAGVAVRAVSDLPPGALRLHYSDGRVVTRYRRARALQVYLLPYTIGSHLVMVRKDGHWRQVAEVRGHHDVSPWSPMAADVHRAVAAVAESGGFSLTEWQRDYLTSAYQAYMAGQPLRVNVPRNLGRPW